jgi:hypothetical protein
VTFETGWHELEDAQNCLNAEMKQNHHLLLLPYPSSIQLHSQRCEYEARGGTKLTAVLLIKRVRFTSLASSVFLF